MAKTTNPKTRRLVIGDRVKLWNTHSGTLTHKRTGPAAFGVTLDGKAYESFYYRDQLSWIDSTPAEPEPYEAWFVA